MNCSESPLAPALCPCGVCGPISLRQVSPAHRQLMSPWLTGKEEITSGQCPDGLSYFKIKRKMVDWLVHLFTACPSGVGLPSPAPRGGAVSLTRKGSNQRLSPWTWLCTWQHSDLCFGPSFIFLCHFQCSPKSCLAAVTLWLPRCRSPFMYFWICVRAHTHVFQRWPWY